MVLHPISTVEVIETMPPPELSLLLRLLEPREDEGEKKRMEIRGKYARAFANLSLPRFLVFFSPLRYNCRTTLSLFLSCSPRYADVQMPNELVIKRRA